MKIEWESSDIISGQRFQKVGCNEVWLIGFDPSRHGKKTPAFAIISLSDGMIAHQGLSAKGVADLLNNGQHRSAKETP